MFPVRQIVAQKIEKQELAKALEEKIPALAREHKGKLNAILRGLNVAFKQAKDRFLDQLEDHLRASMIKLYASEQITRRNKEIERQLSQNMADPDRQKRHDEVHGFCSRYRSRSIAKELMTLASSSRSHSLRALTTMTILTGFIAIIVEELK